MRLSSLITPLRSFDWLLFLAPFLLSIFGLAAIYSVELSQLGATSAPFFEFKKQVLALGAGVVIVFILSRARPELFRGTARLWYVAGLILLAAVLFFGVTIRGTRGWFNYAGFSFQPVEFMKVAVVLVLAAFIAKQGRIFASIWFIIGSGVLIIAPVLLVIIQPDLGSALLLFGSWYVLMWILPTKRWFLLALTLLAALTAVLAWAFVLKPYQKDRVRTFLNPARDSLGAGYNINQSIIAVGSGRLFGRGLGFGSQSQLKFLPESQTDFIFSVIAEELGLLGVLFVLVLFAVFLWRLILLARRGHDDFTMLAPLAIAVVIFLQMMVNIGAAIGIVPVTGLTLPFVSYGGSSLFFNYVLIAIAESIALRQGMVGKGTEVFA